MSDVVLVPGAGGDPAYWDGVRRRLSVHGVRSAAVDLPGPDPAAGLPEYVERVVDAARCLERPIIVGQSLGGFSASWAATEVDCSCLVLVNAMVPVPGETAGEWWAATGQAEAMRASDEAAGRDPDAGLDASTYFLHDVPAEVALPEVRDETDTAFEAAWGPSAWPDVRTLVVAGADDRFFPPSFQTRVARERLDRPTQLVPGGHLNALSRPDELATVLLYLTATTSRSCS